MKDLKFIEQLDELRREVKTNKLCVTCYYKDLDVLDIKLCGDMTLFQIHKFKNLIGRGKYSELMIQHEWISPMLDGHTYHIEVSQKSHGLPDNFMDITLAVILVSALLLVCIRL